MPTRLALLSGVTTSEINPLKEGDAALVQIDHVCQEYNIQNKTCNIYNSKARPAMCNEFPDNLFNKDKQGKPIMTDENAKQVLENFRDYCLALQRIGT